MKCLSTLCMCAALELLLNGAALAAPDHGEAERKQDAARHRAMATAHEAAARCVEMGKPEAVCLSALQASCKGLAIGKYCGMKHEH